MGKRCAQCPCSFFLFPLFSFTLSPFRPFSPFLFIHFFTIYNINAAFCVKKHIFFVKILVFNFFRCIFAVVKKYVNNNKNKM
jgi:hypothetical protein